MFNVEISSTVTITDPITSEQYVSKISDVTDSLGEYSAQGFSIPYPTYNQALQIDSMVLADDVAIFSDQQVSLKINGVATYNIVNEAQVSTAVDRVSTLSLTEGVSGVWRVSDGYAVNDAIFYGSGLNDIVSSGTFTGSETTTYIVKIDGESAPDTYKWSNDGGLTWEFTGVNIVAGPVVLEKGVTIQFVNTTSHTTGDYWTIAITHAGTNYYTGGSFDQYTISLGTNLPSSATAVLVDYTTGASIPFKDKLILQGSGVKSLYISNTSGNTANVYIIASGN